MIAVPVPGAVDQFWQAATAVIAARFGKAVRRTPVPAPAAYEPDSSPAPPARLP